MKHLILIVACLFIMSGVAQAETKIGSAFMEWDASVKGSDRTTVLNYPDQVTYKVYHGLSCAVYFTQPNDAGSNLSYTVNNLEVGTEYCFVVTACNPVGCSGYSNTVLKTIVAPADTLVPLEPANLRGANITITTDMPINLTINSPVVTGDGVVE